MQKERTAGQESWPTVKRTRVTHGRTVCEVLLPGCGPILSAPFREKLRKITEADAVVATKVGRTGTFGWA